MIVIVFQHVQIINVPWQVEFLVKILPAREKLFMTDIAVCILFGDERSLHSLQRFGTITSTLDPSGLDFFKALAAKAVMGSKATQGFLSYPS